MLSLEQLMGRAAIDPRDLLEFPKGENDTDTILGGNHFNLTTLEFWNYTIYGNNTLSNGSKCWLIDPPYQPAYVFPNGSFTNSTKCYSSVEPIKTRGFTGIGFAVAFALALVGVLTSLTKHGRIYLKKKDSRFYPIGRRWQWYWGAWVCGAALIGLFINVDVDRYRVQELPLIVTVFFYYLLCWGTVAMVWEAVRHWGSWLNRQYVDPDPFILRDDDRRSKVEFYLPLWFYFWLWLNFFMVVPRSWSWVPKQRDADQSRLIAEPHATDARFKTAGFCLFICWLTIVFSLQHSIKHYKPRNRGIFNRSVGLFKSIPLRLALIIILCLGCIAYQEFIAWDFSMSVVKFDGPTAIIYGWGYGPSLLILFIQTAYGWASPNEDKELIRQRRERGEVIDRELGISKKPAWWERVRGDHLLSYKDKLTRQVNEVGGRRGVGRRDMGEMERQIREDNLAHARDDDYIELSPMNRRDDDDPRMDRAGAKSKPSLWTRDESGMEFHPPKPIDTELSRRVAYLSDSGPASQAGPVPEPGLGFRQPSEQDRELAKKLDYLSEDGPPPPRYRDERRQSNNSNSSTGSIQGQPQQIRSMLDI